LKLDAASKFDIIRVDSVELESTFSSLDNLECILLSEVSLDKPLQSQVLQPLLLEGFEAFKCDLLNLTDHVLDGHFLTRKVVYHIVIHPLRRLRLKSVLLIRENFCLLGGEELLNWLKRLKPFEYF